ncbi:MAG: hypothetical protein GY724_05305, partial [Actinomycetia bacterium]|nr:hypothetical protein [Actinomycetes bacterium]
MEAFLNDVTILDVGDEATALASELLAELGANVIRVEDEMGDEIRAQGGHQHALLNAGKRSVAINTTTDAGWAPIVELLEAVDVVIGPIEPCPATRRFLDRAVATITDRPELGVVDVVFRRIQDPEATPPATPTPPAESAARAEPVTDLTLTAAGGLTWLCGHPDDPPNQPAGDLGWKQISLAAAEAAMALIMSNRRAGRGGHVVIS